MRFYLKLALLCVLIACNKIASSQTIKNKDVAFYIDTTINLMQTRAIHRAEVNWAEVRKSAMAKAADLTDPYQMGDVMRYLFKSVNDYHGSFVYRDSTFQWNGKPTTESESVKAELAKRIIRPRLLGNIGYIKLPIMYGPNSTDGTKLAQQLNDSLCSVLKPGLKGFIVDLRADGGGSMAPMLLGLEQLLGDGILEYFHGNTNDTLSLKNNRFLQNSFIAAEIKPACIVNALAMPVVVLIGQGTGSSGEFSAMAFKGRNHTLFLGEATADRITAPIDFGFERHYGKARIAISYGSDRNDVPYYSAIQPDVIVKGTDNFNDLSQDDKVKAAVRWIEKQ
jgi:carboxyl-terminal processing protease